MMDCLKNAAISKLNPEKSSFYAHQSKAVYSQQNIMRGTSHDSNELQFEIEACGATQQSQLHKTYVRKSPGKASVNKQPRKYKVTMWQNTLAQQTAMSCKRCTMLQVMKNWTLQYFLFC